MLPWYKFITSAVNWAVDVKNQISIYLSDVYGFQYVHASKGMYQITLHLPQYYVQFNSKTTISSVCRFILWSKHTQYNCWRFYVILFSFLYPMLNFSRLGLMFHPPSLSRKRFPRNLDWLSDYPPSYKLPKDIIFTKAILYCFTTEHLNLTWKYYGFNLLFYQFGSLWGFSTIFIYLKFQTQYIYYNAYISSSV